MSDAERLFGKAERAFAGGDASTALERIAVIERQLPAHPAILHLKGLCLKKTGDIQAAIAALEQALALAPGDTQLRNNLANALGDAGRHDDACAHYDAVLQAAPQFDEARLNRAISCGQTSDYAAARADFDLLVAKSPTIARLHSAYGAMELSAGELNAARRHFDAALAIRPDHVTAVRGRAKVALELGEADSAVHYARAIARGANDRDTILGHAYARQANGDADAAAMIVPLLERDPEWIEGHAAYAGMRWEAGDAAHYADRFRAAVEAYPANDGLRLGLARLLSGSDDAMGAYDVVMARPRALPQHDDATLMQSIYACLADADKEAETLLSRLPQENSGVALHAARLAIRRSDLTLAGDILGSLTNIEPAITEAWALQDIVWRLTDDARHVWLHGQTGLYGKTMLDLPDGDIADIADYLRSAHRVSASPIGQSLRGGTQTRGRLFVRDNPRIATLRTAVHAAVEAHWNAMPSYDEAHPLLRHRHSRPAFDGSWSVRLSGAGFHVQHIHTQGLLSSACYFAVPDACADTNRKPGWIELGRPPAMLNLQMGPLATYQPEPGAMVLFPSTLYHGTRAFDEGERLTVAFDIIAAGGATHDAG